MQDTHIQHTYLNLLHEAKKRRFYDILAIKITKTDTKEINVNACVLMDFFFCCLLEDKMR